MPTNLTKPFLDKLEPKKKKYSITDTRVPGLVVEIYPSGIKTFYLKWQENGRGNFYRLGKYGYDLTLDQARKLALARRGDLAKGIDFIQQSRSSKASMTFKEAMTLYIEAVSAGPNPQFQASTLETTKGYLKTHLFPAFGAEKLRNIKPEDIFKFHAKLRDIKATANRIINLLSSFSHWCISMGFISETAHLTRKIKKYKIHARSFSMSGDERAIFYKTLNQLIKPNKPHYFALQAIKLMYLTGARRNEILTLQISHLNYKTKLLGLTKSKTGSGLVASRSIPVVVPDEVFSTLDQIKSHNKKPIMGYVFPWSTVNAAHTANDRAWKILRDEYQKALDKAGIKPRFQLIKNHDLRHAFASTAIENEVPLAVLSKILGHSSLGYTTERYVHLQNEIAQEIALKKMNKNYLK